MKLRIKISFLYISIGFCILFIFGIGYYLEVRHVINETIRDNLNLINDTVIEYIKNNPALKFKDDRDILTGKWVLVKKDDAVLYESETAERNPLPFQDRISDKYFKIKVNRNIYSISNKQIKINNDNFNIITAELIDERENELRIILLSLIIGFSVFFLVIGITGYIFSEYPLKPFNKITKKINYISQDNLSQRINEFKDGDEVENLAISINNLFERLENSFSLQKNFILNVSHELKTPLSVLRLLIESVLNNKDLPIICQDKLLSALDVIYSMNFLIKKLLLLATLDEVKKTLQPEPLNIVELLNNLYENIKLLCTDKGLKINFEHGGSFPVINADKELINTALFDILDNSIKFTESGSIDIILEETVDRICIIIKDTGIGISESHLEKIFDKFYRVDSGKKVSKGYGIGLSIAKRIVDLHKGEIVIQSSVGNGTTVSVIMNKVSR